MRNYEHTILFSPLLTEEEVQGKLGKIGSQIQEQGGILERQNMLGKRRLGEAIGKHQEAYLGIVNFFANPDQQEQVNKALREEEAIIRILPLTKRVYKQTVKQTKPARAKEPEASSLEEGKDENKVTIQEIDKKLEEIFREDEAK